MRNYPFNQDAFPPRRARPRSRAVRQRRAALFCHLSDVLRQTALRVPWRELDARDRAIIHDALCGLDEAADTAKAALSQDVR